MSNTRVPENGIYKITPAQLNGVPFGRSFSEDTADEARELVGFLQRRNEGWKSFTTHEYHDWICGDGKNCKNRSEKRCEALIAANLVEFADGRYYITTRFVDICAAA